MDKNMTIYVQLIDSGIQKTAATDTFTAAGSKQYKMDAGAYDLWVTVDKANGNSKYAINLVMPEVVTMEYAKTEVVF